MQENISEFYDLSDQKCIEVTSGFQPVLKIHVRKYSPRRSDLLMHVLFRGLEGGMVAPTEPSTPFALAPQSLTMEAIDRYSDSLALHLVTSEGNRPSGERSLALSIIKFAADYCNDDTHGVGSVDHVFQQGSPLITN